MIKLIEKCSLITIMFLLTFFQSNAQKKGVNLLNPDFASFENQGEGWWFSNKKMFIPTDSKSKTGDFSIKYSLRSQSTNVKDFKAQYTNKSKGKYFIKLKAGNYKLDFHVWTGDFSSSKVLKIALSGESQYQSYIFDLQELEKRKWVSVSKEIKIEKSSEYVFIIAIPKNKKNNAKGIFYIDDISLVRL